MLLAPYDRYFCFPHGEKWEETHLVDDVDPLLRQPATPHAGLPPWQPEQGKKWFHKNPFPLFLFSSPDFPAAPDHFALLRIKTKQLLELVFYKAGDGNIVKCWGIYPTFTRLRISYIYIVIEKRFLVFIILTTRKKYHNNATFTRLLIRKYCVSLIEYWYDWPF